MPRLTPSRIRGLLLVSILFLLALAPAAGAAEFGIAAFDGLTADANGNFLSQAGAHPDTLRTAFDFNTFTDPNVGPNLPVEDVKDITVDLPPGFVGGVAGVSQCTMTELATGTGATNPTPLCASSSQIGVLRIRTDLAETSATPVFNMVPPPGVPARFAMNIGGSIVVLDASLARADGTYHVRTTATDGAQALVIDGNTITLWGVPSDPSHDSERQCPGQSNPGSGGPTCTSGAPPKALFRNPTSCTGALTTTLTADSWIHPGDFRTETFVSHDLPGYPHPRSQWGPQHGTDGCERVPFTPTFKAQPPEGTKANTPAAFAFDVTIPQSDAPNAIAQSDLRKAVVTLPQGVRLSPSSADGLGACSTTQIDLESTTLPACPGSSELATVTIQTPLLDEPATGHVYLATPYDNPFNSLVAVYIVASVRGVVVKFPGLVSLNPDTGQISTTFDNLPQIPFSSMHLEFNSGPRAALVAPAACGTFTTHAVLTGWSGKTVSTESPFTVTENSAGQGCPTAFAPAFSAGDENPVAGAFTPFSLRLTRSDLDGEFASLSPLNLPPGLLGDVASVPVRCTDAQAAAAACPAASHIGEVSVGAGPGSNPFYVGGDVYLTGPYKGNPFGIAIVVHAVAGPFDLGYVIVRGGIQIHSDGSVTTLTDPFPTILKGIPLQVRDVRVSLDRPGFIVNPTSCAPMSIGATAVSTANQSAALSSRFQVADCASLGFKPSFKASTSAKTSRTNGASLHVSLAYPNAPFGTQANIAKVHVELPKALPSRLSTLNHACVDSVFNQNPASCPAQSRVGFAKAVTPVLAAPLEGPAYFVSHGGQKFPELIVVLQGEGITIDLQGETFISKAGITSSTFKSVPDVPVGSFELTLPEGQFSALAANKNLCTARGLAMPTVMTAQNGAVIKQRTRIDVTGCKPSLRVLRHSVHANKVTIVTSVPSAGKLTVSGAGLSRSVKRSGAAATLTSTLTVSKRMQALLRRHRGRKLKVTLKLVFTPVHGHTLTGAVTVLIG